MTEPAAPGPPAAAAGPGADGPGAAGPGAAGPGADGALAEAGALGTPAAAGQPAFLDMPLREFLGALASGTPAPGGGASAALTVTLGAGLCAMAARLSARQLDGDTAGELTSQAERILAASAALLQADAESYGRVISAMRSPAGTDPAGRERAVTAALSGAADVPMDIIALGAEAAALAARLAAGGNPALRGDAVTAAALAEAGARAAAVLVGINLAAVPDDERHARAGSLLAEAARSAGAASRPPG